MRSFASALGLLVACAAPEGTRSCLGPPPPQSVARAPDALVAVSDVPDETKTAAYLRTLDLARFRRRGASFAAPKFAPTRIGKTKAEIDVDRDYDFARLADTEARLEGVDRPAALARIFELAAGDADTDLERHLALLTFLQQASLHSGYLQPVYPDGKEVMDPLVLLELGEMRCSHVSRVAVDLFESVGYRARLAQLGGHVVAEIHYRRRWHLFDADLFSNGQAPMFQGRIPSVVELSERPELIDSLNAHAEPRVGGYPLQSWPYTSYYYFAPEAYAPGGLVYMEKARPSLLDDRDYGWRSLVTSREPKLPLASFPRAYAPGPIRWRSVEERDCRVELTWNRAPDQDGDLLGYRVFLSRRSRGWHYNTFLGEPEARAYWSSSAGWDPEMYPRLDVLPPSDAGLLVVTSTGVGFELASGAPTYVSVMPFDAHGLRAGRRMYRMSNELRLDCTIGS